MIAAPLAVVALAVLILVAIRDHTDLLYDDLRRWKLSVLGREVPESFFDRLQPPKPQQPFRLVLALDRPPRVEDSALAERSYVVDPLETYCFEVFVTTEEVDPGSAHAGEVLWAGVTVNGDRVAWFPFGEFRGARRFKASGVQPVNGKIDVRFEVRALATRQGRLWQKASEAHFEFARLYECKDDAEAAGR